MATEAPAKKYRKFKPLGSHVEVWRNTDREVILDGPAGTGKSFGIGHRLHYLCETFPGVRVLAIRKTRSALSESWMTTFEEKVVAADHPIIARKIKRALREAYEYPNGSKIVLGGMDYAERLFSTEYDVIFVNECTELLEDEWETLHRALRNKRIPHPKGWHPDGILPDGRYYPDCDLDDLRVEFPDYLFPDGKPLFLNQLVGDCNPAGPSHWANQRMLKNVATRIKSKHADNPTVDQEYLTRLFENTSGARRERLYYGRWAAPEGAIWGSFDENVHIIDGHLYKRKGTDKWRMRVHKTDDIIDYTWMVAGVDWGFAAAGAMLVAGVTATNEVHILHEVYRQGEDKEWWAEQAERMVKKYGVLSFICDGAEPDSIKLFNARLGKRGGDWTARPCKKKPLGFAASADVVRQMFNRKQLFFWRECLDQPLLDKWLKQTNKPTCTVEEINGYVYHVTKDGMAKEEPDPKVADHGCDALRYMCDYFWGAKDRNWSPLPKEEKYPPGSYGRLLGHDKVEFGW